MASVRVSFPSDLEGMLRSEIWNYKTDPPHNGAGFSFLLMPISASRTSTRLITSLTSIYIKTPSYILA